MSGCMACIEEKRFAQEELGMESVDLIKCPVCRLEDVEKTTITSLIKEAHQTAIEKGWWETDRNNYELLCLIHGEVSEAMESLRKGDNGHVVEELADVLIRIFDLCGSRSWDLEAAVLRKMEFNKTRPYRHGGKLA